MKSLAASFTLFFSSFLIVMPALAETPKQFLDERSDSEKFSYLYGALETAMIMNDRLGNNEKSDCIKDWFAGHAEEANKELMGAVHQVKDRDFPVAAVILILIDKHCVEKSTASTANDK